MPAPSLARVLGGFLAALTGVVVLGGPLLAAADVVLAAHEEAVGRTDVIVVLGSPGESPVTSPALAARLEQAKDLRLAGVAPVVVTVGGPAVPHGPTLARTNREWLLHAGVRGRDVLTVPRGVDTVGSLSAVARLMRDLRWRSATIVVDRAHAAGARAVAETLGLTVQMSSPDEGPGAGLTAEHVAQETVSLLRFELLTRRSLPAVLTR